LRGGLGKKNHPKKNLEKGTRGDKQYPHERKKKPSQKPLGGVSVEGGRGGGKNDRKGVKG